jgi:hypothetical protein
MDRMVRASIDRLGPVREAREEMNRLRTRLEELEESLADLELTDLETENVAPQAKKSAGAKKATTTRKKKAK